MKKYSKGLVWLRRDLRLNDNRALYEATRTCEEVSIVFVFDTNILSHLKDKEDKRVSFIFQTLMEMDHDLEKFDSKIIIRYGNPLKEVPAVARDLKIDSLFFNEDYEPSAKQRDRAVSQHLKESKVETHSFKDQVIFSGSEILKSNGHPYQVFTPYKRAWLRKISKTDYSGFKTGNNFTSKEKVKRLNRIKNLNEIGFKASKSPLSFQQPGASNARQALKKFSNHIKNYDKQRDFPFLKSGTSGLSVHLRFGTISIRECLRNCMSLNNQGAQIWLSELIWREFYQMILDQFPYVENSAFNKKYSQINWVKNPKLFNLWCEGKTGFPIIDAGMRQLNQTGWMHNRVRMITASFLVKDLLIDWQQGEKYFAEKLLDFDLASNNGGWQWCASTGCDAQPYFRVFNPSLQSQRFDTEAQYIKHWIPELINCSPKEIHNPEKIDLSLEANYPKPIVNHSEQKDLAIEMFKKGRDANG